MKKVIICTIFVFIFLSFLITPMKVSAKTLSELEKEANKYISELQEKQNKIAKNDAEVAQIKKNITTLETQIKQLEIDIENLQTEIDNSNTEIIKKGKESKKIIEYYQLSNGENSYLEYIFGSTSITDMIYRISMVEQLTEYNDKVMKELDALIKKNKSQQKELSSKTESSKKMKEDLRKEKERIDADTANIRAGMPTTEQQIKELKSSISYYKNLGCGSNEDVQSCLFRVEQRGGGGSSGGGSVPSTNGFYRPIVTGSISMWFNEWFAGSNHLGIDMISGDRSIAIYPIATGRIFKIYKDAAGALIVVIKHNLGNSYLYSSYVHLIRYANIYEGQLVTPDTQIGNMGCTGFCTGAHLHLEIATCHWKGGGCLRYADYKNRIVNPTKYVSFPSRWNNR